MDTERKVVQQFQNTATNPLPLLSLRSGGLTPFPNLDRLVTPSTNKEWHGTSLAAQWLRILLPMQGTQVWALVWEDPTCRGATKRMHQNYWDCTLEPASHNYCCTLKFCEFYCDVCYTLIFFRFFFLKQRDNKHKIQHSDHLWRKDQEIGKERNTEML